jgi:hypothetical protein
MAIIEVTDDNMGYLIEAVNTKYDEYAFDSKHMIEDGSWPSETLRALDALDDIRDEIQEAGFITNLEDEHEFD